MNTLRILSLLFLGLTLTGCAHAEFDLVEPADLAQHVGTKSAVTVAMAPVEYWMQAYEDHLILRIYNRSESTIRMSAGQSVIVDPRGQSHPLPVQSPPILPGTFVKLILPPLGPRLAPTGPTIGIGFGTSFGSARRGGYDGGVGYGYNNGWSSESFFESPRYYAMYGGEENFSWDWPDNGTVRLVLVYVYESAPSGPMAPETQPAPMTDARPGSFTHQFVFRRKNS